MDVSTIFGVILGALLYMETSYSELIIFPRDTEVLVNHSTYFNCSTSILSEQIHWYHYGVGDNRTNYVYYKGEFNKVYADRYSIELNIETGEYNLIIRSAQLGDAGRYVCQDNGGLGSQSSAQLIILEELFCQSNANSDGLIGPTSCGLPVDDLHLSCDVSYNGNIPPVLQWRMLGDDNPVYKGVTLENERNRVKITLKTKADFRIRDSVFICRATRASNNEYSNCTIGPIQIKYAFEEPLTMIKRIGDTVTCFANTSVPCKYRWLQKNDSICPVACNQVLTVNVPGEYSCEALCTIKDNHCAFITSRISVLEDDASDLQLSGKSSTVKTGMIVVLVLALAVLVTVVIALAIRNLKIRRAKAVSDQNCEILKQTIGMLEGRSNIKIIQMKDKNISDGKTSAETKQLLPYEITIADTDDEEKLETLKNVTYTRRKPIAGIALLENLIYVVRDKDAAVETYDIESLCYKDNFKLKQLKNPCDLASCKLSKCIYIMDQKIKEKVAKAILRADVGVKSATSWSTSDDFGTLSVTPSGNVILTVREKSKLNIYTPAGKRIRVVQLNEDLIHPLHAIQLSDGHFMMSHGFGDDTLHRICIINPDVDYKHEEYFVQTSFVQMETPTFMALNKKGFVFVADSDNGKVFILNSDLESLRTIVTRESGLRCPQRICFDEARGRLFVADNEFGEFNRRNGKLFAVDLPEIENI